MSKNPFDPLFEDLPESLPIFPLEGILLLPQGDLPLNIFEPRYIAMVDDALRGNRLIGMIQPSGCTAANGPAIFSTGCAGRITQFQETEDGRYLLNLRGLCRFRVEEELPLLHGYRRVKT
jgi:Lon protease-like protein